MTVFPIGHYVGERHPDGLHYVRVGTQHQTMTADEWGVWVLAHQDDPQWSVQNVLSLAAQADIPNAATALDRLMSVGLLATGTPEFPHTHRLAPLLVGLGNTPEAPDTYEVGLPGHEPARLTASAYELWQWSALAPTLWHTCEVRARVSGTDTATTAREVLADVRPLLANSCAYLDTTR